MTPECRLYLITPPSLGDLDAFATQLSEALAGGDVAALQIRLKGADADELERVVARLTPIAHAHGAALILNDRPDLAAKFACDGVHLGQEDASCAQARRLMGPGAMIGVTCHDSRHLAMEAAEAGADYVAFGAFFETPTKDVTTRADPEILTIWQETMLIPCVAIGGVTVERARALAAAGADFLAVSSGVWRRPGGAGAAVAAFNREMALGVVDRASP